MKIDKMKTMFDLKVYRNKLLNKRIEKIEKNVRFKSL